MKSDDSYQKLKKSIGEQQELITLISKIRKIDDSSELSFYLHRVIRGYNTGFDSPNTTHVDRIKKYRFDILPDIVDKIILRDSFNLINEYCKTNIDAKNKMKNQEWFFIVKFLRDLLTHGSLAQNYFKEKHGWKKSHSCHGFKIQWENIEKSIMPTPPNRIRPYLELFKEMKKFVNGINPDTTKINVKNNER